MSKEEYEKALEKSTKVLDLRVYEEKDRVHFLSDDSCVVDLFEKHPKLVDGLILYLTHFIHKIYSHREYLALQELAKTGEKL